MNIHELLQELYDDKTINYGQYFNLLTALDKRINQATKTGILQVINKIQPSLTDLLEIAKTV
jgi:hypothetical protein